MMAEPRQVSIGQIREQSFPGVQYGPRNTCSDKTSMDISPFHASKRDHKGVTSEGLMDGLVIEAENLTLAVDKVNGDGLGVPMSGASGETSAHFGEADDIEVAILQGGINTPVRKVANEEK
ncbi:hypothetical protein [uncultured Nitrospira sp.]|uniref:hypothetical protein n=1 Tax=uncultured Nitrospira sp. TaxID=157176 RepID=UPI003140A55B